MHYDVKISGARIRNHDLDLKASVLPTTPQRLTSKTSERPKTKRDWLKERHVTMTMVTCHWSLWEAMRRIFTENMEVKLSTSISKICIFQREVSHKINSGRYASGRRIPVHMLICIRETYSGPCYTATIAIFLLYGIAIIINCLQVKHGGKSRRAILGNCDADFSDVDHWSRRTPAATYRPVLCQLRSQDRKSADDAAPTTDNNRTWIDHNGIRHGERGTRQILLHASRHVLGGSQVGPYTDGTGHGFHIK